MATKLHIDGETFSDLDLKKVGAYRYMQHESTGLHVLSWAVDNADPRQWWPSKDPLMPPALGHALKFGEVHAWNAQFERLIFEYLIPKYGNHPNPTFNQWRCTAAQARAKAKDAARMVLAPNRALFGVPSIIMTI